MRIRLFDLPLTHSMAIAIPKTRGKDGEKLELEKAEAHLWPYLHIVHGDQRPYELYENERPEHRTMFKTCSGSYEYVLEASYEEGKGPETAEFPKSQAYYTREQLIAELPFDKLLPQADREMIFVGATLERVALKKDLLTRLIQQKSHLTVTCILLNPKNNELIKTLEKEKGWTGLNASETSLRSFCDMKTELGREERKRLKIMTYDVEPAFTMVALDPQTNGYMEFGSYISGFDPSSRIMNILARKGMKELFDKYWDEYKAFCESKAKEYTCPDEHASPA